MAKTISKPLTFDVLAIPARSEASNKGENGLEMDVKGGTQLIRKEDEKRLAATDGYDPSDGSGDGDDHDDS